MRELLDLWAAWATPISVADSWLWGHKVVFWGRVGKVLQVVAGLVVLLEIVGPVRLRQLGAAVRGLLPRHWLIAKLKEARVHHHRLLSWRWSHGFTELGLLAIKGWAALRLVVLVGFAIYIKVFLLNNLPTQLLLEVTFWPAVLVVHFTSTYFIIVIGMTVSLALLAVDLTLFQAPGWVLEQPALDRWAKLVAVTMVLIGFHFDFLAS